MNQRQVEKVEAQWRGGCIPILPEIRCHSGEGKKWTRGHEDQQDQEDIEGKVNKVKKLDQDDKVEPPSSDQGGGRRRLPWAFTCYQHHGHHHHGHY